MKKTVPHNTAKMKNEQLKSRRYDVIDYAKRRYKTQPEYLWKSIPGYAVLRHADNRKWYGLIMNIPTWKLGMTGNGTIDILEIKCDPKLIISLLNNKGIRPAYHMKHGGWISVLLDGSVDKKQIFSLLDMSYELTARKRRSMTIRQE